MYGFFDALEVYHSSVSTNRPPTPQSLAATASKAASVVDVAGAGPSDDRHGETASNVMSRNPDLRDIKLN